MSLQWISKEQVMQATGWSAKWIELQVTQEILIARETTQKYNNGRFKKEYSVASLPESVRAELTGEDSSHEKKAHGLAAASAPLFAGHAIQPAATTRVALLDPRSQQKAAQRLAIIQPLLDYCAAAPASHERTRYEQLTTKDGTRITKVDLLALYLAEQHNTSVATIYRWKSAYTKNGGDVALADKRRADKNKSRWAKQQPEMAKLAAFVFLEEKRSVMIAYETVCARAKTANIEAPSYETVRAFLNNPNEVSLSLKTYALEGRRKYEETFAPYLRRGFNDVASNELWVSDHMIHDTLVQDDIFNCDLKHMRLQMTTLLDYHSRYVAGVSWSQVGSSRSVVSALRRGAIANGLPHGFYCDNGKDYKKVGKGAQRHELEQMEREAGEAMLAGLKPILDDGKGSGIMRRLGIPVTYCIPFHPQAKHVERYHNTVHDRFDKAFLTYTGAAAHLRPDRTHAAMAHHSGLRMMASKGTIDARDVAANSALPLASEFIQMFLVWLETYYHATPQRGEGMNGRSPAEVFAADRWKEARPAPTREQLSMLLMDRKECKVDSGRVRIDNRRFVPADGDLLTHGIMHELGTRKVIVCYDPCDMQSVDILDHDGHLLCSLYAEVLMRQSSDEETQQRIAVSMQDRRALERGVRDSLSQLNRDVRGGGYISQADSLREVAMLPAAVGDNIVHRPQPTRTITVPQPRYTHDIASRLLED